MKDFEELTSDQIEHLFDDSFKEEDQTSEEEKEKNTHAEVDVNDLFTQSEGGSSEEDKDEDEENTKSTEKQTSPNNNFYSSIADALVDDGVTPDLDTSNIKDAESFAEAMKSYYESQLSETQKRINDALNNGVEPNLIKFYENTIRNLNSIKDEFIEDENNEEFRKRAIYQDLTNRGYSEQEAQEELLEILDAGNDIKKAKRAIASLKDFYNKEYRKVLDLAKEEAAKDEQTRKERMEALKKDLLENTTAFGDIELTKQDRQKAYDAITKPIWKDPDTGEYYTAIQKYERDHREDFMKKLAILYVKTNNFETLEGLIKGKVNKESKKALRELENKLSNTRRNSEGNLLFAGDSSDTETAFRSFSLDI